MSSAFYSVRDPYKEGYLDVGGGHTIFYHCYGNKNGRPVLFLHGPTHATKSNSKGRGRFWKQPTQFRVI